MCISIKHGIIRGFIVQDSDITVLEFRPLMLVHEHQWGVQLNPAQALYKKNALRLEPERPINVC